MINDDILPSKLPSKLTTHDAPRPEASCQTPEQATKPQDKSHAENRVGMFPKPKLAQQKKHGASGWKVVR